MYFLLNLLVFNKVPNFKTVTRFDVIICEPLLPFNLTNIINAKKFRVSVWIARLCFVLA